MVVYLVHECAPYNRSACSRESCLAHSSWCDGGVVSIVRNAILYGIASLQHVLGFSFLSCWCCSPGVRLTLNWTTHLYGLHRRTEADPKGAQHALGRCGPGFMSHLIATRNNLAAEALANLYMDRVVRYHGAWSDRGWLRQVVHLETVADVTTRVGLSSEAVEV